jgi:hypothetical protein
MLPTRSQWSGRIAELLEWAVPDPEACRRRAEELRRRHPTLDEAALCGMAVGRAQKIAAGTGAATGLASTPMTLVPAAAADAAAMLRIEGELAGTIAALVDPPALDDVEQFEIEVLAVLFPQVMSQALRAVGVRGAQAFTQAVVRRQLNRGLGKAVAKLAAKRLGVRLTEKAVLTKALPLVAVGVGGGWNWFEARAVGRRAIGYFGGRSIGRANRVLPWQKHHELPPPALDG